MLRSWICEDAQIARIILMPTSLVAMRKTRKGLACPPQATGEVGISHLRAALSQRRRGDPCTDRQKRNQEALALTARETCRSSRASWVGTGGKARSSPKRKILYRPPGQEQRMGRSGPFASPTRFRGINLKNMYRLKFVNFVYWKINFIRVRCIARILDCRPSDVWRLIDPIPSDVFCDKCGHEFMATSRSRWIKLHDDKKIRQWPEGYGRVCADCRKIIFADRAIEQERDDEIETIYRRWLRNLAYNQYLQTDHWQEVRTAALRRAGYRCQLCNAKDHLHVHHRTYNNRGNETQKDVIALCPNCHSNFHKETIQ